MSLVSFLSLEIIVISLNVIPFFVAKMYKIEYFKMIIRQIKTNTMLFWSIWFCYLLNSFIFDQLLILCENWLVILTFHHHTHRRTSGLYSGSASLCPFHITNCKCHKFWSIIVSFHQYADYTQLYIGTNSSTRQRWLPRLLQLNPALRETMTGFWTVVFI